ncbi:hypothetical protein BDY19DRAFT_991627 [Irpex rosettiformis]|uniref:Uncharacterized protein n=1 Tax=Irpex rosettiformis TaxID=378272 RepID=A0ACB8U9X6_9APHY|nr:hypothetical protein BDY19DRAFT_991627 [Irpex rosettiformis]
MLLGAPNRTKTLSKLTISIRMTGTLVPDCGWFTGLLESISSITNFEDLALYIMDSKMLAQQELILSRELLSTLFSLWGMRVLKIHGMTDILLMDDDLQALAGVWPDLTEFTLGYSGHLNLQVTPLMSLVGIRTLCNVCSKLRYVGLVVGGAFPRHIDDGRDDVEKLELFLINSWKRNMRIL